MSNLNLIDQTRSERRSEQIVGISASLKSALAEVERVAPTDATVLLLGETGSGKELFARAIHNLSQRSQHPFVKLDCAAIPFDLLDSELFGHEKGAFPWAVGHRIGRFEMADAGTLFLDEIGDLPPTLQPKLLRILQEQEFERPGSSQTHRVNVRLIAATHRDPMGMISQGEFRSDLYYRLNGFPIKLPPLRERREDIPLLVSHFVEMFSRRIGKQIHDIPAETLSAFTAHSWPGNVRELKNLIERALILSNDGVLPNLLSAMPRKSTRATAAISNGSGNTVIDSNTQALPSPLPVSGDRLDTTRHLPDLKFESSGTSPDHSIVFVVDDDVPARESMKQTICREGWQPETFALAQELFDRPRPNVPNCLVVNISPRDISGLELQKRMVIERCETPIIFITDHGDVPTSVQAMKAGAVEFLITPFADDALFDAIREALKRSSIALGREAEMRLVRDSYASLSHRERQVMALVLSGLLNKQVGSELGISEITVKAHRGRVMQKMGAKSVVDLVRMASRLRSERALAGAGQFRSPSPCPISGSPDRRMNRSASSSAPTLAAASGRS